MVRGWEGLRLAGSAARRQVGMRAWHLARATGMAGERHACAVLGRAVALSRMSGVIRRRRYCAAVVFAG